MTETPEARICGLRFLLYMMAQHPWVAGNRGRRPWNGDANCNGMLMLIGAVGEEMCCKHLAKTK